MYKALFQLRKRMTNSAWRVGGQAAEAFPKTQGRKPDFSMEEELASLAQGGAGGMARKWEDSSPRKSSAGTQACKPWPGRFSMAQTQRKLVRGVALENVDE